MLMVLLFLAANPTPAEAEKYKTIATYTDLESCELVCHNKCIGKGYNDGGCGIMDINVVHCLCIRPN